MRNTFLWLLPTVHISVSSNSAFLHAGSRVVRIEKTGIIIAANLCLLDGTNTESYLRRIPAMSEVIKLLDREGWLVRLASPVTERAASAPWQTRQLSYYSHHNVHYPDEKLNQLRGRSVLIIGVGGIGTHVAFTLAATGIGKLILSDPDVVEESNLNRQFLFSHGDIGQKKVNVVKEQLNNRFPDVEISCTVVDTDKSTDSTLETTDIVVLSGERASLLDRPSLVGHGAIISAGYFGRNVVIGPLIAPGMGTACWPCMISGSERQAISNLERNKVDRVNAWNSSGTTINSIAGALVSDEVVRFLSPGFGPLLYLGRRIHIDLASLQQLEEQVPLRACPHTVSMPSKLQGSVNDE